MTEKTEAQPEALRLAAWLNEGAWHQMRLGDVLAAGRELRRLHAEIQQLKAEKAEMARLHFENYEFQRTKADNATATVYQFHYAMKDAGWHPGRTDDDLTEIIRAKGRELAQLSARQAAPDGPWKCGNEYLPYHPDASHVDPAYRDGWNDCYRAAPPPPEREPLTDEQIDELCGEANRGIYVELDQYHKAFRDAERAHGIGATND
ncbi:hypothetical protein [Comamonas sp.]|uniref:hypothetical protein n=1 Tax=Comamonas sp. TaxID=34028 RepID=UPI002897502B|nr:hypothetical protein [Comamonas sp.]